jgi:cytochrome d ubiquinol oxidase subunit II
MLAMYTILDGFDLGAGIATLFISKSEEDRQSILRSIGPYWDGNEVWILAAGGTLYFAFPKLYASSFSGFYLPLMMVLWLLMLRALGIEFRHLSKNEMWKSFWHTVFGCSSLLLAVFLGAALGNVVRGVPLNAEGYFFEPLWTTFTVVPDAGILDWFTVLMGVVALCTLAVHGGNYIAMKTEGELQQRARTFAGLVWWGMAATSVLALAAVTFVQPNTFWNYSAHVWGWIFPFGGLAGLVGVPVFLKRGKDKAAFVSSSLFIGSMLASTAFGLFPYVLPASTSLQYGLTVYNTIAPAYGLGVGIVWWCVGMALATGYFTYLYRSFKGKVNLDEHGY